VKSNYAIVDSTCMRSPGANAKLRNLNREHLKH
jgi:hypothetical protein